MSNFTQIYIAFKTFSSNIVLKIGYGVSATISLIVSIILGIMIVQLYEIPIKDVQIFAHKVYGGDEKDYSALEIKMDYGLGITNKYRKGYEPGIKLFIYQTDNWRKNQKLKAYSYAHYGNKCRL